MYFGKKQRYIEVFQCSGEDMSMVLSGGIPVPTTAPVSPVGKTLISSGMLNTPTILQTPAAPSALTAATAAASLPQANGAGLVPPTVGLAAWDPLAQVTALQMQQAAITQAQVNAAAYRQPQESSWLHQLIAQQQQQLQLQQQMQQQMQLAAFAHAQKPQWYDFNGVAAANHGPFIQALPPPPPLTPVNSAVVTSQAGPNPTSAAGVVNKQKAMMPSAMFPVVSTALHIPQAAGVVTSSASNQQPFVLINIPRFSQPIQSYPGKVAGVTSTSTANHASIPSVAAAFNMPQGALISPTAQYAASSILKRSWEHAFTADGMHGAAAVNVKRPYSMAAPANSTAAIFTVPPPQQSPAQISAQPAPPAVAFQPPQFFAPT